MFLLGSRNQAQQQTNERTQQQQNQQHQQQRQPRDETLPSFWGITEIWASTMWCLNRDYDQQDSENININSTEHSWSNKGEPAGEKQCIGCRTKQQQRSITYLSRNVCVCVSHPVSKGFPIVPTYHISRGQQGIHSSAANEDSCGLSVKQIGTPICVPARFLQAVYSNFSFL